MSICILLQIPEVDSLLNLGDDLFFSNTFFLVWFMPYFLWVKSYYVTIAGLELYIDQGTFELPEIYLCLLGAVVKGAPLCPCLVIILDMWTLLITVTLVGLEYLELLKAILGTRVMAFGLCFHWH